MNWPTIIIEYTFYLSTLGLVLYYKLIFNKINNFEPQNNTTPPPVSIVICAKNEIENLKNNLPHFLNQKHPNFEILIAVDNSNDGSFEWLVEQAKIHHVLTIKHFQQQKQFGGKKEVLSYAIKEAKHEHLLLTDADCRPNSPYWALEMCSAFTKEKQLVLGIGMYEKTKSSVGKFIYYDTILVAIQYLSFAIIGKPYMSVGRNVAYTKSLFNSVNGFSSHLDLKSGDDDLFIQSVSNIRNTTIRINSNSQTVSLPEKNWKNYIQQKSRHHTTGIKYKAEHIIYLGLFQAFTLLFYSSFLEQFFYSSSIITLLTIFFLKNLIQASIFRIIFVKIGVREKIIPFLLFDGIWVLFISYINLKNLFRKNNQW